MAAPAALITRSGANSPCGKPPHKPTPHVCYTITNTMILEFNVCTVRFTTISREMRGIAPGGGVCASPNYPLRSRRSRRKQRTHGPRGRLRGAAPLRPLPGRAAPRASRGGTARAAGGRRPGPETRGRLSLCRGSRSGQAVSQGAPAAKGSDQLAWQDLGRSERHASRPLRVESQRRRINHTAESRAP